jgi:type II secretory pathway component PulJ
MVNLRAREGFTVLETMISLGLVTVLLALGATTMTQVNKFFMLSKARFELQQEARSIMYVMTRELRQAQNSTIVMDKCATASTITISTFTVSNVPACSVGMPPYSRVTFEKTDKTGKPEIMQFYQSNNNLYQAVWYWNSAGAAFQTKPAINMLTSDLQYMAFSFPRSDDMTIISVSMTLQTTIYNGQFQALHMASEKVQVMN